jgi:hypothetical protein
VKKFIIVEDQFSNGGATLGMFSDDDNSYRSVAHIHRVADAKVIVDCLNHLWDKTEESK